MCKVNQKVSGKKRQITRNGSLRNNSIQQVGKTIVAYRTLLREGMAREGREGPRTGVWKPKARREGGCGANEIGKRTHTR